MQKILPLILLLLAACRPAASTLPTQSPAEIQTIAAATVDAVLYATPQPPTQTAQPTHSVATVTPNEPAEQTTEDFWVTYVSLGNLWISKPDGSQPTRLTNTPAQDYLPTWSPDGRALAFLRYYDADLFDGNLLVLPVDSSAPRLLTPERQYSTFAWLPDSRTLLAVSDDERLPESYLINTATGDEQALEGLNGGMPVLSPDGSKIAALVAESRCQGENCLAPNDLYIYDLATGDVTQITDDQQPKEWLAWSPDSKQISFEVRGTDLDFRDYVEVDGANKRWNDQPVIWWTEVIYAVSPDRKLIAYATPATTDGTATTEVFVMPFGNDNSAAKQIAKLNKGDQTIDPYISLIRWLPDSSAVVFGSWWKVYYAPVDGSGQKLIPIELEKSIFDILPASGAAYNPPPEPTAPAQWHVCPGGLRSNLAVGGKAIVSSDPPTPNNVRAGPSTKNTRRGQIQPGEVVEILSGPECVEDIIWWEVRSPSTGLTGWTAEGTIGTYWLSPID